MTKKDSHDRHWTFLITQPQVCVAEVKPGMCPWAWALSKPLAQDGGHGCWCWPSSWSSASAKQEMMQLPQPCQAVWPQGLNPWFPQSGGNWVNPHLQHQARLQRQKVVCSQIAGPSAFPLLQVTSLNGHGETWEKGVFPVDLLPSEVFVLPQPLIDFPHSALKYIWASGGLCEGDRSAAAVSILRSSMYALLLLLSEPLYIKMDVSLCAKKTRFFNLVCGTF